MLKEYTLKVTVRVGGDTESEVEEAIGRLCDQFELDGTGTVEITHEEVVGESEVET